MKLMGGAMKLMGGGGYEIDRGGLLPAFDLRGPAETHHNTAQHSMRHLQLVK